MTPKLALACLALPLLAVPASAESFRSAYTVSYLGMPVARSSFTTTLSGDSFSIDGTLSSAGLAKLFDSTKGTVKVSGSLGPKGTQTDDYRVDYRSGGKEKRTVVRFKGGTVTHTENVPPPRPRGEDWVALGPDDLKAVSDPIAATIVRAGSLDEVCSRTIRTYDGELRADLKLSPVERSEWNGQPTAVCKVSFEPVSGYRSTKRALRFLRDKSRMSIEFTALGATGLYAPVRASVGTEIGTIRITAAEPD